MRIDKRLNLVVSIVDGQEEHEKPDGTKVTRDRVVAYVHSTPVSKETFDANFLVIAKTFQRLHAEGLDWRFAPRVAAKMLEKVAAETNEWEGSSGVNRNLMAEIVRMTNLLAPGPDGRWQMVPMQQAVDQHLVSDEDWEEVRNVITFFTFASWMYPKSDRESILRAFPAIWGGHCESSSCTDFVSGLQTSIETASTGVRKPVVSSIPS